MLMREDSDDWFDRTMSHHNKYTISEINCWRQQCNNTRVGQYLLSFSEETNLVERKYLNVWHHLSFRLIKASSAEVYSMVELY